MNNLLLSNVVLIACLIALTSSSGFAEVINLSQSRIDKWEPAIREFERQDAENPPKKGSVVFVGISSIRRWDLSKSFPDLPVLNRGFGGCEPLYRPRGPEVSA